MVAMVGSPPAVEGFGKGDDLQAVPHLKVPINTPPSRLVEKAEVFCRACGTVCPLLCKVCPLCECAPSFSVSGNFNMKGTLRVLHDGRDDGATNLVLLGEGHLGQVVVKAARLQDDPDEVANLREEVRLQSRFSHPSLVHLLFAAETPSEVLLVTPFVSGGDLHTALYPMGTLSEREARNLCSQLVEALRYLHVGLAILHGDVKPRNVFLLPAGGAHIAQLGDFGLSREVPVGGKCNFYRLAGTHGYFAPELLDREDYDFAVDMFALGVIIFTIVGGYEPFYPASKVHAPLEFDKACWGHVSCECASFVSGLLRTDPELRTTAEAATQDHWILSDDLPEVDVATLPLGAPKPRKIAFHAAAKVTDALPIARRNPDHDRWQVY
jgi:serine/threonine protein kinase